MNSFTYSYPVKVYFGEKAAEKNLAAELANEFIESLAAFIKEIGLPTTFKEMNISEDTDFRAIADTTILTGGCVKKFTADALYKVLMECK